MTDQVKPKNIHQRIAAITGEVEAVKKTGRNNEQKYDFIEYDSVTAALRKLMFTHGITVLQNMKEGGRKETEISSKYGQKGVNLVIDYIFTVTNVDDPADKLEFLWQGEASDYGDKATNKAATAAEKYFLLKLFKIGTKEDPDADSPDRGVVDKSDKSTTKERTERVEPKEDAVEFVRNYELSNLKILAKKIIGDADDLDVIAYLEETLNVKLDKMPRAWYKPAEDKLNAILADR